MPLPESNDPLWALPFVALLAAFAALGRVLYGPSSLTPRYLTASLIVAISTGWAVYSIAASYMHNVGGYMTVAIAIGAGLFTDDFLRRAREHWAKFSVGPENRVDRQGD
jgi:hypothetical protein